MVIERLLKSRWIERRPAYSIILGVFFTLIAFFTSLTIFRDVPNFVGFATISFTVIMTLPIVNGLFVLEEKIEVKSKKGFLKKHEAIFDFYIYFFIGVFIVLFDIALINPGLVFSEQQLTGITVKTISNMNMPPPPSITGGASKEIISIFQNNLHVMIICFALSFFYGSGALFLITLNGSIFASALAQSVKTTIPRIGNIFTFSFLGCNLGAMFLHTIPEVGGYLIAAVSGGVLSKALIKEKFGSKGFNIVFKDSIILLIISVVVLIIAAIIENEISKKLFLNNFCMENIWVILFILAIIILAILIFEYSRKRK
ncbi:MAG: hypothetical protein ABIC04_04410 [Nanoarchaeota archaeon]